MGPACAALGRANQRNASSGSISFAVDTCPLILRLILRLIAGVGNGSWQGTSYLRDEKRTGLIEGLRRKELQSRGAWCLSDPAKFPWLAQLVASFYRKFQGLPPPASTWWINRRLCTSAGACEQGAEGAVLQQLADGPSSCSGPLPQTARSDWFRDDLHRIGGSPASGLCRTGPGRADRQQRGSGLDIEAIGGLHRAPAPPGSCTRARATAAVAVAVRRSLAEGVRQIRQPSWSTQLPTLSLWRCGAAARADPTEPRSRRAPHRGQTPPR